MSRSKLIIIAGALVAILPILGFPGTWEAIFQVFAGFSIIGLSIWTTIDKKLSLKVKARERAERRRLTDIHGVVIKDQNGIPSAPEV